MSNLDDAFTAFANQVELEELERQNRKNLGGVVFEKIKWTGLPEKGMKIIRGLGAAPNSGLTPDTARTVRFSKIRGDNGKESHFILPNDDKDHILWRIINNILAITWDNGKKIFINEGRYPDIFNIVKYNNYPVNSLQHKYTKGWAGRDMFVMNCIDRTPTIYQWSRDNKHTVLLSKGINTIKADDGATLEFAEFGVPDFGFRNTLALNIFKHYGDWNRYDLGIERLATMQNPYRIINASQYLVEVPENLKSLVVTEPLSEEEASWERYNLDQICKPSSYTKIYKRLARTIAKIDLSLGTSYSDELEALYNEEAKNIEPQHDVPEENEGTVIVPVPKEVPKQASVEQPVSRRSTSTTSKPKGYEFLNTNERDLIISMKQIEGDHWDIKYKETLSPLVSCEICKTESPSNFDHCPGCGATFTF